MWCIRVFRKTFKSWNSSYNRNSDKFKSNNIVGKVSLYAQSEEGYKNLTKLSSLSYLNSKQSEDPACEIKDLIDNNQDLILLSGNYRNFFGKLFYSNKVKNFNEIINLLKKYFDNRLYFEIQRHNENEEKIMKTSF